MVEGPECHRVAEAHRATLLGRRVTRATSPNGKFAEGASAIEGKRLTRIEVHGKALFYFFEGVVVYIHFGMAGAFEGYAAGDDAPAVRPTTRLALAFDDGASALLSAMTVEHGTEEGLYVPRAAKLGPDPLRDDADFSVFRANCAGAKKRTVAALLLDQSKIAGVGNILRSEICAHAGVHPSQPAASLPTSQVARIWEATLEQMRATFETGSIWDPVKGPVVYGCKTCRLNGGRVETWRVNGRALYACTKHQRVVEYGDGEENAGVPEGKAVVRRRKAAKAMASAGAARAAKRARGEALNRQHTALKDGDTRAAEVAERASKKAPKKAPKKTAGKAKKAPKKAAGKAKKAPKKAAGQRKMPETVDEGRVRGSEKSAKSVPISGLRRSGRLLARQ